MTTADLGAEGQWISLHLFPEGPEFDRPLTDIIYQPATDRFILHFLAPFIAHCDLQAWLKQYYFVRYNDLRNQIRLRMRAQHDVIDEYIVPRFQRYAMVRDMRVSSGVDFEVSSESAQLAFVRVMQHDPATEFVQGVEVGDIVASYYSFASQAALMLLRSMFVDDRLARLEAALGLYCSFVCGFEPDGAGRLVLARSHLNRYSHWVASSIPRDGNRKMHIISALKGSAVGRYPESVNNGLLSSVYKSNQVFAAELRGQIVSACNVVRTPGSEDVVPGNNQLMQTIACRCLHRIHNCLGITPFEEVIIAEIAMRALRN